MESIIILKNFNSLCRLCLVSGVELTNLFNDNSHPQRYGEPTLIEKIEACTNLKVTEDDDLPRNICRTCNMKVGRAFEFRQQANRSYEILKRYANEKVDKIKEEIGSAETIPAESKDLVSLKEELIVQPVDIKMEVEPELVADIDPSILDDEDDENEDGQRPEMEPGEFEPMWMDNGNEGVDGVRIETDRWVCQYCNVPFMTEERYKRHITIHTPEPPFPCDYCDETFDLRADLKYHWRVHSDGNPHICQMCGQSFPDRMTYLKHSDLHDEVKPYRCPICQKSFCYGSDLRKHAITHTGVRPYICSVCGNSFTRSTSLNKHLRMHNGNRPFSCSACPKIFGSRGDLKRHQIIHSGIKPWICTVCSVPFNRKDKLVRHEKLHSGEPRPFQCYECPTSFSRKEDLTKHVQFHHYKPDISNTSSFTNREEDDLKTNALDQINKTDLERGNRTFRALVRETFNAVKTADEPEPEPSYKCDICHKRFYDEDAMESHKKIHTTVKPYGCSMCDKSFYRRRELNRHEAVHTGYKPFSCGVCAKKFSRTDKLNRHMQTHQLSGSNWCERCNQQFESEVEFNEHLATCMSESEPNTGLEDAVKPQSTETLTKLGNNPEILLLPIV